MTSKLKGLLVIQLLLCDLALCRVAPPQPLRHKQLTNNNIHEGVKKQSEPSHALLEPKQPSISTDSPVSVILQEEEKAQSAKRLIEVLQAKLQGQIQDHLHIQGKVSCEELLTASTVDDSLSYVLPQELLGLSLVPVLVVANCQKEAQTLVEKLYDLLGVSDAEELLMDLESLMERKMSKVGSTASSSKRNRAELKIEAVMFNIQQLAEGDNAIGHDSYQKVKRGERCEGWTRLNGTTLIGSAVEGPTGTLDEAVQHCEELGVLCAGVAHSGPLTSGRYKAVLKKGSCVLPSESESWILQCSLDNDSGRRLKRSPQKSCINMNEQQVHNVMEWIPAVSTLYNLGTAVYYASVNCSETAKERAILTAVDLGTDALMVVTGGTAGVAGYALGAGVKTGVKAGARYLMNSMKEEEDILVNQFSWEDDTSPFSSY